MWKSSCKERAKNSPTLDPGSSPTTAPQFIARDFKDFIRISGMTHVKTSPYYPESNGKVERWHKTLKSECIRPAGRRCPSTTPSDWSATSSTSTTHFASTAPSAMSRPQDKLEGRQDAIFAERTCKTARSARTEKPLPRDPPSNRASSRRSIRA